MWHYPSSILYHLFPVCVSWLLPRIPRFPCKTWAWPCVSIILVLGGRRQVDLGSLLPDHSSVRNSVSKKWSEDQWRKAIDVFLWPLPEFMYLHTCVWTLHKHMFKHYVHAWVYTHIHTHGAESMKSQEITGTETRWGVGGDGMNMLLVHHIHIWQCRRKHIIMYNKYMLIKMAKSPLNVEIKLLILQTPNAQ